MTCLTSPPIDSALTDGVDRACSSVSPKATARERVLLSGDVLDAASCALVGDGWGHCGHRSASPSSSGVGVKVTDAGDFGAMVDHLAVDVQHQRDERMVGVRAFGGAARPVAGRRRTSARTPVDPFAVLLVELLQRGRGIGRVRASSGSRPAAPPKCEWLRIASTPTMTCASRQAIVVNGVGLGRGVARSRSPRRGARSSSRAPVARSTRRR